MPGTPLPVNLLCGYLGAGKTTLLNRLLTQDDQRILVMVNDFGDIAVDAALISARSADTIQLSNGCICCSMAGGMFDAFERALSWRGRVDRLVIEASGVAEPARLTAFARAEPDLECRAVVVVVDPQTLLERLDDPRIGTVLWRQIEGADIACLSRQDLITQDQRDDIEQRLLQINPSLVIADRTEGGIWAGLDAPHCDLTVNPLPGGAPHSQVFARATLLRDHAPDRVTFLRLLHDAAPRLHRLKGFVRFADRKHTDLIQVAGKSASVTPAPADPGLGPAVRLVLIGPDRAAIDDFTQNLDRTAPPDAAPGNRTQTQPNATNTGNE